MPSTLGWGVALAIGAPFLPRGVAESPLPRISFQATYRQMLFGRCQWASTSLPTLVPQVDQLSTVTGAREEQFPNKEPSPNSQAPYRVSSPWEILRRKQQPEDGVVTAPPGSMHRPATQPGSGGNGGRVHTSTVGASGHVTAAQELPPASQVHR